MLAGMSRLVLDGYNVLLTTGRGAGEADRQALAREAAAYRADRGIDVLIVFDSRARSPGGGGSGGEGGRTQALPGVSIEFAPGDADTAILEIVRRSRTPGDLRVVTSDRRLAAAARDLGARTIDVAEFGRGNAAKRRQKGSRKPSLAHAPALPRKEVEEWLRVFGERKESKDEDG
jgi:predicted RNA-binding protein with PIN domain